MITTIDSQYQEIKDNCGVKAANDWYKAKQEDDLYNIYISEERQNEY